MMRNPKEIFVSPDVSLHGTVIITFQASHRWLQPYVTGFSTMLSFCQLTPPYSSPWISQWPPGCSSSTQFCLFFSGKVSVLWVILLLPFKNCGHFRHFGRPFQQKSGVNIFLKIGKMISVLFFFCMIILLWEPEFLFLALSLMKYYWNSMKGLWCLDINIPYCN